MLKRRASLVGFGLSAATVLLILLILLTLLTAMGTAGVAQLASTSPLTSATTPPAIPRPLPAVIPEKPPLKGSVALFVEALVTKTGAPLSDQWTNAMSAPLDILDLLPSGWRWRGGAAIVGGQEGMGGLSGIEVEVTSNNVLELITVSDRGFWLGGVLERQESTLYDRLLLSQPLAMKTTPGARPRQYQTNAEALTLDSLGNILVALEGDHRIQRHADLSAAPSVLSVPTALRSAHRNRGIEALATLPDGRFLAVSEGVNRQGGLRAWLFHSRSGDWPTMVYRKDVEEGVTWNPTAAAVMGDEVLLVERWWDGAINFRTRLVSLPIDQIAPDAVLRPTVLFELTSIVGLFGNIEGLSVVETTNGHLAVFLTDNQQISLLPTSIFAIERQAATKED